MTVLTLVTVLDDMRNVTTHSFTIFVVLTLRRYTEQFLNVNVAQTFLFKVRVKFNSLKKTELNYFPR